eukprot:TRINITY_DN58502_c0_g1_i1.p1 TRINITY_DN58502_c0_g1~~TRINITY_DN58502_c0_g1_i1.p1  ORF type:complete len:665 (-),score=181.31 TRINITY_DN58502_c0_g1_i1:2-1996(-)
MSSRRGAESGRGGGGVARSRSRNARPRRSPPRDATDAKRRKRSSSSSAPRRGSIRKTSTFGGFDKKVMLPEEFAVKETLARIHNENPNSAMRQAVDAFLQRNPVEPHAAARLQLLPAEQAQLCIQTSLAGARDPTAVLLGRIRNVTRGMLAGAAYGGGMQTGGVAMPPKGGTGVVGLPPPAQPTTAASKWGASQLGIQQAAASAAQQGGSTSSTDRGTNKDGGKGDFEWGKGGGKGEDFGKGGSKDRGDDAKVNDSWRGNPEAENNWGGKFDKLYEEEATPTWGGSKSSSGQRPNPRGSGKRSDDLPGLPAGVKFGESSSSSWGRSQKAMSAAAAAAAAAAESVAERMEELSRREAAEKAASGQDDQELLAGKHVNGNRTLFDQELTDRRSEFKSTVASSLAALEAKLLGKDSASSWMDVDDKGRRQDKAAAMNPFSSRRFSTPIAIAKEPDPAQSSGSDHLADGLQGRSRGEVREDAEHQDASGWPVMYEAFADAPVRPAKSGRRRLLWGEGTDASGASLHEEAGGAAAANEALEAARRAAMATCAPATAQATQQEIAAQAALEAQYQEFWVRQQMAAHIALFEEQRLSAHTAHAGGGPAENEKGGSAESRAAAAQKNRRPPPKSDKPMLPGDWICPDCGDHQFQRNHVCRHCGGHRPADSYS